MEKPPRTSGGFQRFPIEGHICCGACHRGQRLGWRTLRGSLLMLFKYIKKKRFDKNICLACQTLYQGSLAFPS